MPWFKIDDGFHCHPKVLAAGTPAVGLYVRCGSWAAQQASDGIVPKAVARMYGTPRMIKSLIDAGLWHQTGHACAECPQLDAASYAIHQYLAYNPSRTAIETDRSAKSERQRRWRERKKDGPVDASTGPGQNGYDDDLEASRNDSEAKTNQFWSGNEHEVEPSWGSDSEQIQTLNEENVQVKSGPWGDVDASTQEPRAQHGDACPNPAQPNPTPPSPKEKEGKTASYARDALADEQPRIPTAAIPLVDALTNHGMTVGWNLTSNEWFLVEALIKRCGIPHLVTSARGSWQGARQQPRSGRYFIPAWRALPDSPAESADGRTGAVVPFRSPTQRPSTTDDRVKAALDLGREMQAEYDAAQAAKEAQ